MEFVYMSRTYKDRPYWVRANDKKEVREATHDHLRFGKTTKSIKYGEYTVADYCTIDEPLKTGTFQESLERPCYYDLSWSYSYFSVEKLRRNMLYWSPMRAEEKKVTCNAVKDYNTFGEVDEDLYLRENTRHSIYRGGYWD
jgi:hypothetical protein